MSGKKQKKIRQLFRKTVAKKAEEMGKKIGNVMKPKPRFIPWFIWLWMMGFFIKLK